GAKPAGTQARGARLRRRGPPSSRGPQTGVKRLIVNADDFGLTANVNRAILDGHCRGVITSASLLSNGEAFESAVALALQTPRLGVGVHLNLTEGKPVAAALEIPSLVNGGGL